MQIVYVDVWEKVEDGFLVEVERYTSPAEIDEGNFDGRDKFVAEATAFGIGCYYVYVRPKQECRMRFEYDMGKLVFVMDKKEQLVGDFKKDFLIKTIDTDKVEIHIDFY